MPPTQLNTIEVKWFDSRYDTDEDVKDFFNDTDFKVIEKREYEPTLIAYLYTQRSDSEHSKLTKHNDNQMFSLALEEGKQRD